MDRKNSEDKEQRKAEKQREKWIGKTVKIKNRGRQKSRERNG